MYMPVVTRQMKKNQYAIEVQRDKVPGEKVSREEVQREEVQREAPVVSSAVFASTIQYYLDAIKKSVCKKDNIYDSNIDTIEKMKHWVYLFNYLNHSLPLVNVEEYDYSDFVKQAWFKGFNLILAVEQQTDVVDSMKKKFAFDILNSYKAFKPFIRVHRCRCSADDYAKLCDLITSNYNTTYTIRDKLQQSNFTQFVCAYNYFKLTPVQKDGFIGLIRLTTNDESFVQKMKRILR